MPELKAAMRRMQAGSIGPDRRIVLLADLAADPLPYEQTLARATVIQSVGPVKILVERSEMTVAESHPNLEKFVANFEFPDDAPRGAHVHFEFYPGNPWIDPDSIPLVISVG